MRSEHLRFFLSLAQTGSILQSSRELYTTHQNVSKIIRQLESELGCTLFVRSRKGVTLTPGGKLLLPLAQHTVDEFSKMRTNLRALEKNSDISGDLHILSADLATFSVLSSSVHLFTQLYPSVTIRLENKEPLAILEKITLHPQIVGVVVILNNPAFYDFYKPYIQQVQLYPLLQDTYSCVVGAQSPLANYKSISLTEFSQQPFATTAYNENGENILTKVITSYGGSVSFL